MENLEGGNGMLVDEAVNLDVNSFASSDISLASEGYYDGMSASYWEEDPFDDKSTLSSEEEDFLDMEFESHNEASTGLQSNGKLEEYEDSDEESERLEFEDSLNLTMMTTNRGTIMIEAKGAVTLQKCGHLEMFSRLQKSLPVPFVTNLLVLTNPLCLKQLKFCQISFSGSILEFEEFAKTLCCMQSLEQLHFVDCCLLNTSGSRPLDTILHGISTHGALPKLRHLELYAVDIDLEPVGSSLSAAALGHLVRNKPSLTEISFEDLTLGDEHVIEMARAVENHKKLKKLKLWGCAVGDRGMVAMARMLERNNCVEELEFSYNDIGEVGCIAVAKALVHQNNKLKDLRLVKNDRIVKGGKGYLALLEMVELNHTIETLLLQPPPQSDADLAFYLFVNRRRYLLEDENTTKSELLDVLCSRQREPTFLFHFLKAKPALFEC